MVLDLSSFEVLTFDCYGITRATLGKVCQNQRAYDEMLIDQEIIGAYMEAVLVSPKFQVVIPRAVREALRIQPGQRMQVIQYEDRIE